MNIIFLNLTSRSDDKLHVQANEIVVVQPTHYTVANGRRNGTQLTFKHGHTLIVAETPDAVMSLMAEAARVVDGGIALLD